MSITVKDCLSLDSFKNARVVAGHKGLDNIVNTVSVLEYDKGVYNDNEEFFSSNELLISSFYSIKDDIDRQCKAIEYFKRTGNVGIVLFYVGDYLKKVESQLIEIANILDFPIIVLPQNINLKYSEVISDVMERVILDKRKYDNFSEHIFEIINKLPDAACNINNLLHIISEHTKTSLVLCTSKNNVIAKSIYQNLDIDLTATKNLYKKILASNYDLNLYYLNINNLTSVDLKEIETIILYFIDVWHYRLDITDKKTIIPAVLSNNKNWISIIENEMHICTSNLDAIILIKHKQQFNNKEIDDIGNKILQLAAENKLKIIVDAFAKFLVVFTEFNNDFDIKKWFSLNVFRTVITDNLTMAVSYDINYKHTSEQFYKLCCEHLQTAEIIFTNKDFFTYADINFAERCNNVLTSAKGERQRLLNWIEPLLSVDNQELLETFCIYCIDADCEVKTAAKLLYVHRNTILYRIKKINTLLRCNFTKMPYLYDAYISAAIIRINQY